MGNENIINKFCGCKEIEETDISKKDKVSIINFNFELNIYSPKKMK
jgi:hypothetical protein